MKQVIAFKLGYCVYILVVSAFRHTVCANAPKTFF